MYRNTQIHWKKPKYKDKYKIYFAAYITFGFNKEMVVLMVICISAHIRCYTECRM